MSAPSFLRRLSLGARGYAVVLIFCFVLLALHYWVAVGLTPTEILILSAALAVPLALALFLEYIKAFKLGPLEITFNDAAVVLLSTNVAETVQKQRGSATPKLVETIAAFFGWHRFEINLPEINPPKKNLSEIEAADQENSIMGIIARIESGDFQFLEVNLQNGIPNWWSTRLFLLAALADEYTDIERLVFVEKDADRIYIGMAKPHAMRLALQRQFPNYMQKFQQVHAASLIGSQSASEQISRIMYAWSDRFPDAEGHSSSEEQVKVSVTATELRAWLGEVLETDAQKWDGSPATHALYAKILMCKSDYVALLRGQHLEMVVSANRLARLIAEDSLGIAQK